MPANHRCHPPRKAYLEQSFFAGAGPDCYRGLFPRYRTRKALASEKFPMHTDAHGHCTSFVRTH